MKVKRGECSGESGNSGRSSGPHLHYEVIYKDKHVNPANYYVLTITPEEYSTMVHNTAEASDKITLHIGDAKETIKKLKGEGRMYDLVFIDANKREYTAYYELVFDMVRPGGYILADNVLWDGKVYQENVPNDAQTQGICKFNQLVKDDPRVENVILPLRDGMNLIRKIG
jgi:predicted O-methyltransferase YrrM